MRFEMVVINFPSKYPPTSCCIVLNWQQDLILKRSEDVCYNESRYEYVSRYTPASELEKSFYPQLVGKINCFEQETINESSTIHNSKENGFYFKWT